MRDFDVVFIGSGHSCWHGALTLVQAGKKVALVDNDFPGGTCTNYGCDAKFCWTDLLNLLRELKGTVRFALSKIQKLTGKS